jgi:adenylate cyclase
VRKADSDELIELRIPADRGIVGYVASAGETLNIPDAYKDPRFDPAYDKQTGYRTRTILCMPVFNSAGKLIAVTQLINKRQGIFNSSDEEFMRAFNIQSGIALENAKLFENVLVEKQYQKDMLQSLSDAVISTDLEGRIVTINDAALELLGCPEGEEGDRSLQNAWEQRLINRLVWDVIPVEKLQFRLEDSLETGAKHYVPEQTLKLGLWERPPNSAETEGLRYQPVVAEGNGGDRFWPWGDRATGDALSREQIQLLERSINLTVNPLTNPEGGVRGGLLVLEDISQEKRMKTTLYRYMTPGVAERVMALGDDVLMRGERREVSVLFSDIRGYTTLTENLEADKVVEMLNAYFETMVEAVFNFEGTLDKFIGDAIMAVYGAPLPLQNHAWASVQSALDMRERLVRFNHDRAHQNQPMVRIGVGISSGEVVSGNIGSQRKMEYTVIGDGVNLSSRLEGITKQYGCDILISEYTYELCKDQVWVREVDKTRVKGKNRPVSIYELIGSRSQDLDSTMQDFLGLYRDARTAYTAMNFEEAIRIFKAAEELRPGDRAVDVHIKRAKAYLLNPPPANWDGVHTMTTK